MIKLCTTFNLYILCHNSSNQQGGNMKFPHEAVNANDPIFIPAADPAKVAAELIIKTIGEDIDREGLLRTPQRFSKAIKEICSGYQSTAKDVVGEGVFSAEGKGLVSVKEVEYFSLCEHHMLPFWGRASVAYYPQDLIVGLSKIPRIVDVFSRRLQVQERLTREIAESLHELINARAVAVKLSGSHMCMMMRGVRKTGSDTTTEFAIGLDNLTEEERRRIWKAVE
jgi:GTP cyclohydrolase IA